MIGLHQKGWLYADEQQNAVFTMRELSQTATATRYTSNETGDTQHQIRDASDDAQRAYRITGAFLRGTRGENNSFLGYAQGTKRTQGWFYFCLGGQPTDEIQKVVLCKSPIDALSCATLGMEIRKRSVPESRTMYLAVDSARSLPLEFLRKIPKVIAAYGNDEAGLQTAQEIKKLLPQTNAVRPELLDWNEELLEWKRKEFLKQLESTKNQELSL